MNNINEMIRQKALERLSEIMKLPVDSLDSEMQFKNMLKPSFVSMFKRNEFDILLDDIRDVSNSKILKKLEAGGLIIDTVDDYINHMINCYSENPDIVNSVLKLTRMTDD